MLYPFVSLLGPSHVSHFLKVTQGQVYTAVDGTVVPLITGEYCAAIGGHSTLLLTAMVSRKDNRFGRHPCFGVGCSSVNSLSLPKLVEQTHSIIMLIY